MSRGGGAPPDDDDRATRRMVAVLGWRARLEALQRRVLRQPAVLRIREVLDAYDRGGGGLLAAALAYFAFFTMVPALLLFVSVLGIVVEDRSLRDQLLASLVDQIEPVEDVATVVVEGLATGGRTGTIIGILGLLWGASGFYGALEGAMARMFPGSNYRDFVQTRLRGLLAVVLVLGSMLLAVVIIFTLPFVQEWLERRCAELDRLDIPLLVQACAVDLGSISSVGAIVVTIAVASLASLLVYVVVPTNGAAVRQALLPAVLVGVAIGLFTSLFGLVAPLLVREWLTLGIVGGVFIALVWFRLVFQALLYGAGWARLRRDRARRFEAPPTL